LGLTYTNFVDYSRLDPVKKRALEVFSSTLTNLKRLKINVAPLGETSAVLDFLEYDFMLAFNIEGLGTKNLIADEMYTRAKTMKVENSARYYRYLGQDALAMSITDLIAVGADPIAYVDAIASGSSQWFDDIERNEELIRGYKTAADLAGCAIPQGETPTLPGIVFPETLDLVGSSIGIIRPKTRFTLGQKIVAGDAIYGMSSGGICSNGISKARAITESLKDRYFTMLPSGLTLGEELLKPTPIYVKPIREMFESGVDLHYISPITGHGWRKIARARFPFVYIIENVPEPPVIFSLLKEWGTNLGFNMSRNENYQVWNMGIFITLIASSKSEEALRVICERHGVDFYKLGHVEKGERQVIIKPIDVTFRF
jgi:phosphoribosylformylglycinamidine cyclo-ligase